MIVRNGIDVSKHNGQIDWNAVKASNKVEFAILRAGLGRIASQKDKQFERNYSECKHLDIPIGAYWYSYAMSPAEARQEAKAFLEVIKGKTFEYPVYFDIEEDKQLKLGKKAVSDMIAAFCETLEDAGYFVGVYTSRSSFQNYVDNTSKTAYTSWVAEWGDKLHYTEPADMWQKSDKGTIPGIQGRVDLDECYRDFPSIIKRLGKNGFEKQANEPVKTENNETVVNPVEESKPTPEKPVETIVNPAEEPKITQTPKKPVEVKKSVLFDVKIICNSLNIRTGPSLGSKSIGIARNGEVFSIVEERNGWGKIAEKNCWISILNKYVKKL
jgi:GH25 family lysozyme M1 (1,4-beta-N-acetylmuramidase)